MSYKVIATIRRDKIDSKGLAPIYILIYHGKSKTKISIRYKVSPVDWDEQERRVKKKVEFSSLINSLIDKKISEIKTKILTEQIITEEKNINVSLLIRKGKIKDASFFDFAEEKFPQKNYSAETRRGYRIYLQKLQDFKTYLRLKDVTFEFLQAYESHLRDELGNQHNTIWGNFKFINTMTNDALKMGYLAEDPFRKYKRVSYKQTERVFLESEELERMEKFINQTSDEGLRLVGKYFLFMAYTGLRFSDAVRFQIARHVVNDERIVIETQKTKQITNLFINDQLKALIIFIGSNPLEITQVDFNRKLKVIAAGSGIDKKVSSHVARHSFGSLLADLGVSMEVAKGLLSHGSISSTKIYYHLKSSNYDEAMKKFNKNE